MQERLSHLTVVIGASEIAEELRRSLAQQGVAHAGVASHLRGLRRSMVLGESEFVIVCIAMDDQTIARHGSAIRQLLADHRCFPKAIRSVGLLTEVGLTPEAAAIGCDVYVHDSQQATKAVRLLARRYNDQQKAAAAKRLGSRHATIETNRCDTWLWGTATLPVELVPLMTGVEGRRVSEPAGSNSPLTHESKDRSTDGVGGQDQESDPAS